MTAARSLETATGATTPDADAESIPLGAVLGPTPIWAVAAILGALAGEAAAPQFRDGQATSVAALMLGLVVAVSLGIVPAARRRHRHGRDRFGAAAGLLAAVLVAAACGGGTMLRIATTSIGLLPEASDRGGRIDVLAVVIAEPRPIATGWHVLVRVVEVDGVPTRERAALTLDERPPALGSRWRSSATVRPLPDGGYGRWLAQQHAMVVLAPVTWEASGSPGRAAAASEHVRDRVRLAATRHLEVRTGGLLVGFVTGDTRLLPDDDQDAMRETGLTHLTAVSGSNVAIVLGGVLLLATIARVPARGRRWSVGLMVPWFAFVTRFEPSVLRAGSMALLVLLTAARGVPRDARHALAGAVLLLLLIDPRLAGSLGLLLSATATAGVLIVAPVVRARLPQRLPRRLAELGSITIGAQIAVVPLLLLTFGEMPLASIPANLVAVPAAAVAATIAFVGTAVAVVHLGTGSLLFALAGPPAQIVLASAHGFRSVGAVAELGRPLTVVALLAGCAWLLSPPGSRRGRWLAAVTVLALVAGAIPSASAHLPTRAFTVTAIDVGQGDAFLIESPGARILVDGGTDDTAARWLRRNGRTRLDLAVVTHPHLDHVGGIPEVVRRLEVAAVWSAPLPTDLPEAAEVFSVAAERGIPVRAPIAGEVAHVGDLVIEVLHPPPGRPYRWARSERNESSYVLRIHHGDRRVLVTGDIETTAQGDLLRTVGDRLDAEMLTVPHHGGGTSDPRFLTAIGAQVGLIGVGRENRHGHPHPEVLATLETAGVTVRRTDLEGTVTVEVPSSRRPVPSAIHPSAGSEPASCAQSECGSRPCARSAAWTCVSLAPPPVGGKSQAARPVANTLATRRGSEVARVVRSRMRSSPPGSIRSNRRPASSHSIAGSRPVSNQISAVSRKAGAGTRRRPVGPSSISMVPARRGPVSASPNGVGQKVSRA